MEWCSHHSSVKAISSTRNKYLTFPLRIRQMPAELLKFPIGVLRVKVAGFKPLSVNRQEDVLPYSPEWSLKATMEMFDLLQTDLRASVVVSNSPFHISSRILTDVFSSPCSSSIQACEPELTVLLYNTQGELVHLPLIRKGLAELDWSKREMKSTLHASLHTYTGYSCLLLHFNAKAKFKTVHWHKYSRLY